MKILLRRESRQVGSTYLRVAIVCLFACLLGLTQPPRGCRDTLHRERDTTRCQAILREKAHFLALASARHPACRLNDLILYGSETGEAVAYYPPLCHSFRTIVAILGDCRRIFRLICCMVLGVARRAWLRRRVWAAFDQGYSSWRR
jgi:hypothetical protein